MTGSPARAAAACCRTRACSDIEAASRAGAPRVNVPLGRALLGFGVSWSQEARGGMEWLAADDGQQPRPRPAGRMCVLAAGGACLQRGSGRAACWLPSGHQFGFGIVSPAPFGGGPAACGVRECIPRRAPPPVSSAAVAGEMATSLITSRSHSRGCSRLAAGGSHEHPGACAHPRGGPGSRLEAGSAPGVEHKGSI